VDECDSCAAPTRRFSPNQYPDSVSIRGISPFRSSGYSSYHETDVSAQETGSPAYVSACKCTETSSAHQASGEKRGAVEAKAGPEAFAERSAECAIKPSTDQYAFGE